MHQNARAIAGRQSATPQRSTHHWGCNVKRPPRMTPHGLEHESIAVRFAVRHAEGQQITLLLLAFSRLEPNERRLRAIEERQPLYQTHKHGPYWYVQESAYKTPVACRSKGFTNCRRSLITSVRKPLPVPAYVSLLDTPSASEQARFAAKPLPRQRPLLYY